MESAEPGGLHLQGEEKGVEILQEEAWERWDRDRAAGFDVAVGYLFSRFLGWTLQP